MSIVVNWTDALIYLLLVGFLFWFWRFKYSQEWFAIRKSIINKPRYLIVLMILILYTTIGFLDSLHFKSESSGYRVVSVLDILLSPRSFQHEITYSAPFALTAFSPEMIKNSDGTLQEVYPKLQYAGKALDNSETLNNSEKYKDIGKRVIFGLGLGLILTFLLYGLARLRDRFVLITLKENVKGFQRVFWLTLTCMICLICIIGFLLPEYHILGTDKVGRDVFYIALKSIRTGLVIGTVTLLVTLPFALLLGMWAGFFGGWIDDVVQYTYTTLSSVPGVLLIAAAMLSFQRMAQTDPDLRLVILCIILGVTSWTTLCRLLRGETLKLRESDFVQAAIALGTRSFTIIKRHIMPNLMHIVIITAVLDFSGLVLAEAVLSYVGVGVDPTSYSWGNMINASRLEMGRDPVVWWSLLGSLILMFVLVFSANIFADVLQAALNPRAGDE